MILKSRNASVHIVDIVPPSDPVPSGMHFYKCNTTSWTDLLRLVDSIPRLDMVFANAGVSEEKNYFADTFDADGKLEDPGFSVLDVNLRGVLNVVKLGWSKMRRDGVHGSIVLTTSATAYAPEQSLPVYSAGKLALVGLVRALRSTIVRDHITINAVAPAATITKLLPAELAAPIMAAGLPVSSAHFVGLALVHSATATQSQKVESYGKDQDGENDGDGRWNGRIILTLGERYTELEEGIAGSRKEWFGVENTVQTRLQQIATDFR
jgi:NAD(P)-dependent dehydrogenase (short-subunit alcohol dehydrogenase family)